MATEVRVKHTVKNLIWSYVSIFVTSFMPFLIRRFIIHYWDMEYLGLTSLYSSILNVLNISELGIGTALVYNMYKPVAKGDFVQANQLLSLYQKFYRFLGLMILMASLVLMPFLPRLIQGNAPKELNIYVVYIPYIAYATVSYWVYPYSSAVYQANQDISVTHKYGSIVWLITYSVQIIALAVCHNFYIYAALLPIGTFLAYFLTGRRQRKQFPQYVPAKFKRDYFDRKFWYEFKHRVVGLSFSKLRTACRASVDVIIVSAFLGLADAAKYQNYIMVMTVGCMLISSITTAVLPSLGNAVAVESRENNLGITKMSVFVVECASVIASALMVCGYQPFMLMYAGEDGLLTDGTAILFVIYFYLKCISSISDMVRSSSGIWWEGKWVALFETGVNIVLNLIFINIWGIEGVVVATIVSLALINIPLETYYIYKYYFQLPMKFALMEYIKGGFVNALSICIVWVVTGRLQFGVIVDMILGLVISSIILLVFYYKSEELAEIKNILLEMIKRKPM